VGGNGYKYLGPSPNQGKNMRLYVKITKENKKQAWKYG
jgi:hypothetical protein